MSSSPTTSNFSISLKEKLGFSSSLDFLVANFCRILVITGFLIFAVFVFFFSDPNCPSTSSFFSYIPSRTERVFSSGSQISPSPLTVNHLAFGLQGSEKTCQHRKNYLEAWWRPNITRGYVYLDMPPTGALLPWSPKSPPYRVNDDLSKLIEEIKPRSPLMPRMVHGILELFREEHEDLRWLIMGDDDTIFFVDNLIDVLSKYDHRKYYYIGYPSEYVMSNFWFNFNQAFGGGGIILSYPLVKALVRDMDRCLRTYSNLSADLMTMACISDIGVNLTPHKGVHQTDIRGDISGFLSSHPKDLVLSLHHLDLIRLFPKMDQFDGVRHVMKAGNVDQSRLFQQTICYHRTEQWKWTFSISWGYSAHIYENNLRRSWLQTPIETFENWVGNPSPPKFMFQTRRPFGDPCEAPHVFFLESIQKLSSGNEILTVYSRSGPRDLPPCTAAGNHSAEFVSKIHVISPASKRTEIDRCECCDVDSVDDLGVAKVRFRDCMRDEIVA